MRRKLACDAPEETRWTKLPEDDPKEAEANFVEVVALWRAAGKRVVLLDAAAQERLSNVPPDVSLPAIVQSGRARAATATPGYTPVFAVYIAPERLTYIDDLAPFDGAWVLLLTRPLKLILVYGAYTPEGFVVTTPEAIDPTSSICEPYLGSRTSHVARAIVAATAALLDPLWVRSVVVHSETPAAPHRARRRNDPRARPLEVLRLTPDAHHVVRHAAPVIVVGPGPRRRVGRGIVLGTPIAEHDVRGHVRRHPTTRVHAEQRGWSVLDDGDGNEVVALVPVRPHVRGKGPRRTTVIRP